MPDVVEIDSPAEHVIVERADGHLHKVPRVGVLGESGRFDLVWEARQRGAPELFPISSLEYSVAHMPQVGAR